MSEHDDRCPCGTGETYAGCCARYLAGGHRAPTAEALMRSRYTGFATGASHYLLVTWHPSTRPDLLELDDAMVWHRLDVVATDAGGPWDEAGTVEIQRLLAWYFREDPPRHIAGTRDLRDAA
jgi:SEC-C motif-containing protein